MKKREATAVQLVSVNAGTAQTLHGKRPVVTGILKRPQRASVRITRLGLAGDTICDARHHGGVDQAVYVYGQPDYDWWSGTLGRTFEPGTFGENLTIAGLESAHANIGDRYEIGDVLLEVTSPRIPCATLAARMDDSGFVNVSGRRRGRVSTAAFCAKVRCGPATLSSVVPIRATVCP